jgi:hypothetical protein
MECEAYQKKAKSGERETIQIYFRRETRPQPRQRILGYYLRKTARLLAVRKGKLRDFREEPELRREDKSRGGTEYAGWCYSHGRVDYKVVVHVCGK